MTFSGNCTIFLFTLLTNWYRLVKPLSHKLYINFPITVWCLVGPLSVGHNLEKESWDKAMNKPFTERCKLKVAREGGKESKVRSGKRKSKDKWYIIRLAQPSNRKRIRLVTWFCKMTWERRLRISSVYLVTFLSFLFLPLLPSSSQCLSLNLSLSSSLYPSCQLPLNVQSSQWSFLCQSSWWCDPLPLGSHRGSRDTAVPQFQLV